MVHAPVLARDYYGYARRCVHSAHRSGPGRPARSAYARRPARPCAWPAVARTAVPASTAFWSGWATHEFVSMGSSLKFCLVAEGAADVLPAARPDLRMGYRSCPGRRRSGRRRVCRPGGPGAPLQHAARGPESLLRGLRRSGRDWLALLHDRPRTVSSLAQHRRRQERHPDNRQRTTTTSTPMVFSDLSATEGAARCASRPRRSHRRTRRFAARTSCVCGA